MVSNGDNAASGPTSQSIIAEPFESQNVELKPPAPHSTNALLNLQASPSEAENVLSESEMSRSFSVSDSNVNIIPENTGSVSDTLEASKDEVSKLKENAEHLLSGILDSTTTSISKAQTAVEDTYDTFVSSVRKTVNNLSGSLDNATSSFFSSVEKSKEQADSKLTVFSGNFKDSFYGAGNLAIDILRKAIVSFEGLLVNVTSSVVYSYESAKTLLPAEVKDTINTAEAKVLEILMPIGTVFQKVYIVIEGLEKNLGLDPNDPLVQFTLTFISSATLGFSYWILKYGGYSGDLTPGLTLELLKNDDDAVLIDVRPEDLRKRDGVPDLRRKARFKYASVNLPEVASSTRKLLRNIKDVDDALTAAVIRNLKIVQDGSKVIVLDASGDHSKRIARSLRKLGVKKPYLVQGGFRSWVTSGLRAKELKPETTLSVLNEEAEAILEDIRPTPALIFGYGLGAAAVVYALLEWEKTLQLIGVLGLGQTLYRRVASYADSRDLSEDIRLLLYPVRLGAQAFSWATAKLEPNKIGLPTSPSSTAVQDRVLQAAAKHESQPPDADQSQNPSLKVTQKGENLDLSEA
uniref:Calcium sensing receptor, chloroplastic n=2 Tax=Anthurium amnicola TaxID=1678845 RepID=A0A1D1Z363_9ARAE